MSKKTAHESYMERRKRIKSMLRAIAKGLDNHAKGEKLTEYHWGNTGDLGYVEKELVDVVSFLNGNFYVKKSNAI